MENFVELPFFNILKDNLAQENGLIQVILGPRQVGKTTTVLQFLEKFYPNNSLYKSADAVLNSSANWLEDVWKDARRNAKLVVIDEVQKIENWSEHIKKLWDEDRKNKIELKCLLLGSSSLDIHKGLSESLTGRFQLIRAYHWNYAESKQLVSMELREYLKFGGYPKTYLFKESDENFFSYLQSSILNTVIEKDILSNHTVKSPALFKQAFELICSYPAQEISYTKLLGQLQEKGNTELVKHYISLYEGAYLVRSIPKYSEKILKRKTSSPKLLPLCPAFYYLNIQADYNSEETGRVFELIVGATLSRLHTELYYWREGNKEVDFVIKKGKRLIAIEVKSGRRKSEKGLDAFVNQFSTAEKYFITPDNYSELEKLGLDFFKV